MFYQSIVRMLAYLLSLQSLQIVSKMNSKYELMETIKQLCICQLRICASMLSSVFHLFILTVPKTYSSLLKTTAKDFSILITTNIIYTSMF